MQQALAVRRHCRAVARRDRGAERGGVGDVEMATTVIRGMHAMRWASGRGPG
jgi:hypothetical protein